MFVVDVMDATLTNCEVFTWWHAHDAKVALVYYKRTNGIPSSFGSLYQFWLKCSFGLKDLK
jgi:hypothetical protein